MPLNVTGEVSEKNLSKTKDARSQQLTINDNPLPKIALIVSQALNTASYSSKLVIF